MITKDEAAQSEN